jgi:uncharacterized protein YqcC (DUF446 family)
MTASLSTSDHSRGSSEAATAFVERSAEFLACAKTALKIGKNAHKHDPNPPPPHAWWEVSPTALRLLEATPAAAQQEGSRTQEILEDGLALLRTMEAELKQLESLVRRRGQTNDPTNEITASTRRLQQDTKELTQWLPTIIPPTIRRNGQAFKHYSMIQEWFQQAAKNQGKRLEELLKVRGKVLAEQARRRKHFQATSERRTASSRTPGAGVNNNPLFQLSPPPVKVAQSNGAATSNGKVSSAQAALGSNGTAAPSAPSHAPLSSSSAPSQTAKGSSNAYSRTPSVGGYPYYPAKPAAAGYLSSSPYATVTTGGYGGGGSTGMRQRRAGAAATVDTNMVQQQEEQTLLLQRQQERQSQLRQREAREAEKGLASLVGLFGKMSVRDWKGTYSYMAYVLLHFSFECAPLTGTLFLPFSS